MMFDGFEDELCQLYIQTITKTIQCQRTVTKLGGK